MTHKQTCAQIPRMGTVIFTLYVGLATASLFTGCDRDTLTDGPNLARTANEEPEPSAPVANIGPPRPEGIKVQINEIMLENVTAFADEDGEFGPWLEIYNPSDAEFTLAGVDISDDLLVPAKWTIPEIPEATIAPGGHLVVFLDGKDRGLHANFRIEVAGRLTLLLSRGSDDRIFNVDVSPLGPDQSMGRTPDGDSAFVALESPTPNAANAAALTLVAEPEDTFIRGDANHDGRVNITDVVLILRVISGDAPLPYCEDPLDTNDDGAINVTDAVFAGKAIFGGDRFPAPYPHAGTDATTDGLECPLSTSS